MDVQWSPPTHCSVRSLANFSAQLNKASCRPRGPFAAPARRVRHFNPRDEGHRERIFCIVRPSSSITSSRTEPLTSASRTTPVRRRGYLSPVRIPGERSDIGGKRSTHLRSNRGLPPRMIAHFSGLGSSLRCLPSRISHRHPTRSILGLRKRCKPPLEWWR